MAGLSFMGGNGVGGRSSGAAAAGAFLGRLWLLLDDAELVQGQRGDLRVGRRAARRLGGEKGEIIQGWWQVPDALRRVCVLWCAPNPSPLCLPLFPCPAAPGRVLLGITSPARSCPAASRSSPSRPCPCGRPRSEPAPRRSSGSSGSAGSTAAPARFYTSAAWKITRRSLRASKAGASPPFLPSSLNLPYFSAAFLKFLKSFLKSYVSSTRCKRAFGLQGGSGLARAEILMFLGSTRKDWS